MKKRLFPVFFIIICSISALNAEITIFPFSNIETNHHSALLRSPAIDALYAYSTKDSTHYSLINIGARIPGVSIKPGKKSSFLIGGYGGIYTRFKLFSESFNFIHADFLGGLFFEARYNNLYFETMVYHNSSHLGDDYIHYENKANEIENTGFEAARQYINYKIFTWLDLTAGFEYKFGRRTEERIFYNWSFLVGSRADFISKGKPFFVEFELETTGFDHSPNIGIKAGIYLKYLFNTMILGNPAGEKEAHELSIQYYYGYSKMGCFYTTKESLFIIGPTYRF
ncbi:MAG: DUF1207 domain-containing protein [bacterium]|nr:DUF1207 domain-containing protein [bacterium]